METVITAAPIIEEDPRIPFQFQIVREHSLKPIRKSTNPVNPRHSQGKFSEAQNEFEKKVSN